MDRLANAVILSWGWRRRGFAFGAGALSALAMPPFFLFPILWATFPILVWLIDGSVAESPKGKLKRFGPAFAAGWWFGFGYFLGGLWWVGAAFLVEAEKFGWLMPVVALGLPAGLALFWGAACAAAQLLWSEDWRRIFSLAATLGAAEWLRGTVLSGFPWNAIGYALTAGEIFMQSAALLGIQALTILAVAIFAAPAVLAPAPHTQLRNRLLPSLAIVAVAVLGLYGTIRLAQAADAVVPDVTVRIVQPGLDQLQKWNTARKDETLSTYYRLSASEEMPLRPGTLLVWPESAFPFPLMQEPGILAAIAELLPEGTALATGAYRIEARPGETTKVFNTIYLVGADGAILDTYDKVHLVPLGEYLPGAGALDWLPLRQLTPESFSPGLRREPLSLPFTPPFIPLICYEIVFSGQILDAETRPGFLLNLTNDGWFGRTTGPHQHFHQARVRAVEEGLPLVRAANTGVSAVIDGYGRIITRAGLGEVETIEAPLPTIIDAPLYAELRMIIPLLFLAVFLCLAASKFIYAASPA